MLSYNRVLFQKRFDTQILVRTDWGYTFFNSYYTAIIFNLNKYVWTKKYQSYIKLRKEDIVYKYVSQFIYDLFWNMTLRDQHLPYKLITEWTICKLAEELGNKLVTFDFMYFSLFDGTSPACNASCCFFFLSINKWHLFCKKENNIQRKQTLIVYGIF